MNPRSGQDARPLVAVVAGLVLVGLAAVAVRPVLLAPVVVVWLVVLAGRVVATRRSLASRTRLVVLAPDSFDPGLDAVLRCAAQLSRVRRHVGGWLDPRARAVRVLLDTDSEGRMRYSLTVPTGAVPAVRSALGAYDHVQTQTLEPDPAEEPNPTEETEPGEAAPAPAEQTPEPEPADTQVEVVRAELRLSRPSSEPLAHLPLRPDPLQSIAHVLASLDTSRGEQAQIAIDLLPAVPAARRRLRRRLLREARRRDEQTAIHDELGMLGGRRAGRRRPAETVQERAAREEIATKLLQAEPLFGLQILIRCCSPQKGRAIACLQGLLSCFDGLAGANSLRVAGVRVFGLAFAGSDLPGVRGWFDRRMRTGLFHPARPGLVSAREITGFLKPPTVHCAAPDVLRLGPALHPAPKTLPTFNGQADLVPLGTVEGEDGSRRVGLRLEDSFFTYTAGRSRWGKSELALTQFLHLVRAGHGGLFLDPHQDAITRIKSCLTDPGLAARVVELDLVGPRSQDGQPGWNLLAAHGLDREARERRVEAIVDSFASALQWGERNNRALTLTTQATAALVELATILPEELQPTIFQIPSILGNPKWLAAALPFLSPARRQFFTERFPRLSEEAITPVTNLIDRLRSSTQLAALLGAQATSYDITRAMDERRIVLACPGAGGARDRLVANLLVFDLLHAAKARAHTPVEKRTPFYVFLDEIQTFDGASSGNLAGLLEQTAKYGIRGFLLNQNPERLTRETLNALTTNRSHLITTALNAHAAGLIAREWGGQPPADAVTGLPRHTFIAQATHHGQLTHPFLFTTQPVEEHFADAYDPTKVPGIQPVIDEASGRTEAAETITALDTLDERIRQHLEKERKANSKDDSEQQSSGEHERAGDQPFRAPAPADSEHPSTQTAGSAPA